MGEGTELGKLAQKYMDEGKLVPDEVVVGMVEDKIKETLDAKGFIFDGFPRTINQAAELDKMLTAHGLQISGMVALEVPEDELRARIKERAKTSGRVDDQDDAKITTRIRVYEEETSPVAGYYKQQGKFNGINGVGTIEGIFNQICTVIDSFT